MSETITQAALSEEEAKLLLIFSAGASIFEEGDLGAEMYLVQRGEVEIVRQGKRLALLKAGDFFGEMALLEGLPRAAAAKAASDCAVLPVDAGAFDYMIRNIPELAIRMMRKLSGRLRGRLDTPRLAPPTPSSVRHQVPKTAARLVHEGTGREFGLPRDAETTIGRPDSVTGIEPDVDLSFVPEGLSVSRKHARIVPHGEEFSLVEEIGVANGTSINDDPLRAGRPVPLQDGDRVLVGQVKLRFRAAAGS